MHPPEILFTVCSGSFTSKYFTEYPVNNPISVPVLQSISNK